MLRIGEFSKLTRVSVRMLRYYDEMGLLRPARVDRQTGYRLYTAAQIPLLNRIVFLRDLGLPVAEMADELRNWTDARVAELLDRRRAALEGEISVRRAQLADIEQAGRDLANAAMELRCNVAIRSIPACRVLSLRRTVPDYYAEGALWEEMAAYAKEKRLPLSDETFTIYHDEDYRDRGVDMEVCAPVAELRESADGFVYREVEAAPVMACTMVHGPFERIAGAFAVFAGWLERQERYRMTGPSRQMVHRGPWNETDPEQYLTEIQIPLAER